MLNVHPFPARMAPELALNALRSLNEGDVVLDPMAGSGTVLQQAKSLRLLGLGRDLDPLAVLISKVATTPVMDSELEVAASRLIAEAKSLSASQLELPWIDADNRSKAFVNYWFAEKQELQLRRIALVLARAEDFHVSADIADALRIALSRVIVTKASRASLAQDTSHSRPHRVRTTSDYDVFAGYEQSIRALRKRLARIPAHGRVQVIRGDARALRGVGDSSVDMVLTSPPYLNAIDYMRGHKMSLIWFGFDLHHLTDTRSSSIGAERRPDALADGQSIDPIINRMGDVANLPTRYQGMIARYAIDLRDMLIEVARVLKPDATATFVMGNSCLKGVYIENSEGLIAAGELIGLAKVSRQERDLPNQNRYLPMPSTGALSKRMRKEVIVTFRRPVTN